MAVSSDQQDSSSSLSPTSVTGRGAAAAAAACSTSTSRGGAVKKVRKRKSRAAPKAAMRVLSANKSTFRDMVLQFTGNPCTARVSGAAPLPHPNNEGHSFIIQNPIITGPLSTSHSYGYSTLDQAPSNNSPSADLPHNSTTRYTSSPYALLDTSSQVAIINHIEINFRKNLAFLQALKHTLSHGTPLNFGLLGQYDHDGKFEGCSTHGFDVVDLDPLLGSPINQTPQSINTYGRGEESSPTQMLDMEHVHNTRQAAELESFLLTGNEKLDEPQLVSEVLHEVASLLSLDTIQMHTPSLKLARTCF